MNDEVGEPERMKARLGLLESSFISSGATPKADFNQRTKINLTSKLPNPSRGGAFRLQVPPNQKTSHVFARMKALPDSR